MKSKLFIVFMLFFSLANGQVQLDSLLTGCFNFNGNAGDSSGYNNHGSVVGATLTNGRSGNPNTAYYFDAVNDYIKIPNFNNLISGDEISISIWAQTNVGGKCLFMLSPDSVDRCVGCAMYQRTLMIWDYGSFTSGGRTSTSVTNDTNWHHYVYVLSDSLNFQGIYMDDSLIASSSSPKTLGNKNRDLFIGAGQDATGGNIRWNGKIDNVYIYNRAITTAEVNALYSGQNPCESSLNPPPVPTYCKDEFNLDSSLAACYSFSNNAADSSGNNFHGIVNGPAASKDRYGHLNNAYYFDGLDDNIVVQNFQNMNPTDDFTVSMWAKRKAGGKCLFLLSPDNSERCAGCAMYQNNNLIWDYGNIFSGGRMTSTVSADTNWHHYVFMMSHTAGIKSIYMDTILMNTSSSTVSLTNKNRSLLIGAGLDQVGGNIFWKGWIDDILVYRRCLSPREISAIYQGDYPCSKADSSIIDDTTTIGLERQEENRFLIFPNPVHDEINILRNNDDIAVFSFFNSLGLVMFEGEMQSKNFKFNVSELPDGIYFLIIQDKSGKVYRKKILLKH